MLRLLLATILTITATPLLAADIGLSISVGEPGFYGRIDIGKTAKPEVIYARPVIIHQRHSEAYVEPIYLRVPPGYEKHWGKHCHQYNACGQPVYFVRDSWYDRTYASRDHEHNKRWSGRRDEHEHHGHEHGRDHYD